MVVISDFRSKLPDFLLAMELRPQYSPIQGSIFSCKRPIIQHGCGALKTLGLAKHVTLVPL